jgi:hypothetical protein
MRPSKKSSGQEAIIHYSAATHQGSSQGQSTATWEQNAAAIKFVTYLMLVGQSKSISMLLLLVNVGWRCSCFLVILR